MNLLLLKRFNNYFNRKFKFLRTINNYKSATEYLELPNINFNPNDGVTTTQIIGGSDIITDDYDYLVVYESPEGPFLAIPSSRWFIIESKRTRLGQYELTLKRDTVVDNKDIVLNAPTFIQKGIIKNASNPLIFNREGMTYNEIKSDEILLQDKSKCAWIVGYIPRDKTFDSPITAKYPTTGTPYKTYTNISDWPYYNYLHGIKALYLNKVRLKIAGRYTYIGDDGESVTSIQHQDFTWNDGLNTISPNTKQGYQILWTPTKYGTLLEDSNNIYRDTFNSAITTLIKSKCSFLGANLFTESMYEDLRNFNNKIIFDSTANKYYVVSIQKTSTSGPAPVSYPTINASDLSTLNDWIQDIDGTPILDLVLTNEIRVTLSELEADVSCTVTGASSRYHLLDSPYDMFCIPYGDAITIYQNGSVLISEISKEAGIAIATALGKASGDIYDLQLLPYCPIQNILLDNGHIDIGNRFKDNIIDNNTGLKNLILWCNVSSFSFDIEMNIDIPNINDDEALSMKIANECDKYRLCSPNWNNYFEFNLAKNGGNVSKFNVDCTYKPFNPYIHINPDFKGLYGKDYNDARGLICGGDFSLPQVIDGWATYERNNKNYQLIFDRQMQSLDLQNKYAKESDILNAVAGSLGGTINAGAAAGVMTGMNPIAIAASAGIGGATSAIAGIRDIQIQDELRRDNKQKQLDMFNYQLGNIQALPLSLSKVSAFTYNNKLWPVLEYYTCTEIEKQALINKINYEGMTIMTIGTLGEYNGYVKGEIIRLEGLNGDSHTANDIYNEISKGIYLP